MTRLRFFIIAIFLTIFLSFSYPYFLFGLQPVPADTLVGLYNPFRDFYSHTNPNGIPFKNFLITDPIRQQFPWRELSIAEVKNWQLPLWNPYNFTGTPLLANIQSGVFYPLNFLFLILPFATGWSLLILSQTLLIMLFMYLYLRNLRLSEVSAIFGALVFSFSGFVVAWYEWGTIVHTLLWLPLILLAIDKIFVSQNKKHLLWIIILIFAYCSSFFAGHIQVFFYLFIYSVTYFVFILYQHKGFSLNKLLYYSSILIAFLLIASILWFPFLQLTSYSARDLDIRSWLDAGWFIPWQHLIQFIAPDFFGNPTALNYWGTWNYGEMVGYVGILPLILALLTLTNLKDKYNRFFIGWVIIACLFVFPTVLAMLPFQLSIPLISTSQPTRLLSIIDFSLAVLAAKGMQIYLKQQAQKLWIPVGIIGFCFILVWGYLLWFHALLPLNEEHLTVATRNTYLPTALFIFVSVLLYIRRFWSNKKVTFIVLVLLMLVTSFDLLHFADKFLPFVPNTYVFPQTKTLTYLQNNLGDYRMLTSDDRILPPNITTFYKLQTIEGYDSLYLKRYGQLIDYDLGNTTDYNDKLPFNRIVTDPKMSEKLTDFLGVKYILSLQAIKNNHLVKVFTEGQTQVYENNGVFPRAFFVNKMVDNLSKDTILQRMFNPATDLRRIAFVEDKLDFGSTLQIGNANIIKYSENNIIIGTQNEGNGFLVLTDAYYPIWKATIDGTATKIYLTDYNYRGILVTKGVHTIQFTAELF